MSPCDSVRVLTVSTQTPTFPGITPPHSLKLSFLDHFWHFTPPNQRVLFYNTKTYFPTLVHKLREALSLVLRHFYPLAGKIVWVPESDELEIQCGGEWDSVVFIEAETDADFQQLVEDDIHNVAVYRQLVPPLDISELPAPLLSVKVTRFISGGICIGVSSHHMAVDGGAFWHFMKSWAEICKGGDLLLHPSHDRSVIRDIDGTSKVFLDHIRSDLPKVKIFYWDPPQIVKRTFQLSSDSIQLLKERATKRQTGTILHPVSTFVAITAHAWTCSVAAQQVQEEENSRLIVLADCRSRLDPPVEQGYFGNCVKPCILQATGSEILGQTGFGFAVTAVRRLIREKLEEPLKDSKSWFSPGSNRVCRSIISIASSPRFRVYETDFGWGRPSRVELASMNGEGSMVLAEKKDDEGGLQVSIALAPPHMEEFAKLFLHGLDGGICN